MGWIYSVNKDFLWLNVVLKHVCLFPDLRDGSFEMRMPDAIKTLMLKSASH